MPLDYLPVTLAVDHPHPELAQWVADRFEVLNGHTMQIIQRNDIPAIAQDVHPQYMKAWLWDIVPETTQRILFMDWDIIPLRQLPEIPDVPFAAAPDDQMFIDRRVVDYPAIKATGTYFNAGFFIARRDTQSVFDQVKLFAVDRTRADHTNGDFEQTYLNLLIQAAVGITWLPYTCNVISLFAGASGSRGAVNLHLNSLSMHTRWVVMNACRTAIGLTRLSDRD